MWLGSGPEKTLTAMKYWVLGVSAVSPGSWPVSSTNSKGVWLAMLLVAP